MPLSSFLTKRAVRTRFRDPVANADILLVDVTISESATFENEVTENPVEDGPSVTDHIRSKPVTLQVDGFFSQNPLTYYDDVQGATLASAAKDSLGGFASSAGAVVGGAAGGGALSTVGAIGGGAIGARLLQNEGDLVENAKKALLSLAENKTIFNVVSKFGLYEDMTITSLTFPRDQSTGRGLKFQARLKQVVIIETEEVYIGNIARSAAGTGAPKKDMGEQAKKPAKPELRSALNKLSELTSKGFQSIQTYYNGGATP